MQIPKTLNYRLQRFAVYLCEEDADYIRGGGDYLIFEALHKKLQKVAHIHVHEPKPSKISFKDAEEYAWKLGTDLMEFAKAQFQLFAHEEYD
jgi:hypothetical protein